METTEDSIILYATSNPDIKHTISLKVANISSKLSSIISDIQEEQEKWDRSISIPDTTPEILSTIVDYMIITSEATNLQTDPKFLTWKQKLVDKVSSPALLQMMVLVQYLRIPELDSVIARIIGPRINGKSISDVRKELDETTEFTPEEDEDHFKSYSYMF